MIIEVNVTDLAYRWLSQEGYLRFNHLGQLCWYGVCFTELRDSRDRLLYRVGDTVQQAQRLEHH